MKISIVHLTKISIMEGVKISVKMSFNRSYALIEATIYGPFNLIMKRSGHETSFDLHQ